MWAFGLTILELFTSEFPLVNSRNFIEIFQFLKNSEQYEANFSRPCSDEFKHFIRQTIIKEPSRRATAIDLLAHPWIQKQMAHGCGYQKFIDQI